MLPGMLLLLSSCTVPFTVLDSRLSPAGTGHIVLSFDDGPNAQDNVSARLLDVLGKHRVPAVFFFLGSRAAAHPEMIARAIRDGHQVGGHGYRREWPYFFSAAKLREEVARTREAIEQAGNVVLPEPLLYRPPRGVVTPAVRALASECEVQLAHLTFYARDSGASTDSSAEVMQAIRDGISKYNGGAIVLHSSRYRSAPPEDNVIDKSWLPDAVEALILWARSEGFAFTHYTQREGTTCPG